MQNLYISIFIIIFINGCTRTHIDVKPLLVNQEKIDLICILENTKVVDPDLLVVIQNEFSKRGIKTKIYRQKLPDSCKYKLYYTAHSRWDINTYLKDTSLEIRHGEQIIASIKYKGPSGLNSYKRQTTQIKLEPAFESLLHDFSNK